MNDYIDKSVKGVLVLGLYPGSKAEGLDLQPGDVVTKINGKKTKNLGTYFKRMRKAEGDKLILEIKRKEAVIKREIPIEKVYYNAQFFLAASPHLDASALFSQIDVGIGAIRYCKNDDELALIMGHELAHTTLRHSLKKFGGNMGTTIGFEVLGSLINAATFPGVGTALMYPVQMAVDAKISRRYETEADYFGMKHAFHSGYDVKNGSEEVLRPVKEIRPGLPIGIHLFHLNIRHPEGHDIFHSGRQPNKSIRSSLR